MAKCNLSLEYLKVTEAMAKCNLSLNYSQKIFWSDWTYLVFTLRMNLHKYDDYILPHMSFISVCLFESKLQRNKKKINLNLKLPCAYMHEWIMD